MSTVESLVAAALEVLEREGESQFSTRAVCALAGVTAPTLYHHFANADALLSAAVTLAFEQFLASKKAAVESPDPLTALAQGWDNYVRFASERPKLYSAMMSRILLGADIPAARQAHALLLQRVGAVAEAGMLAIEPEAAADVLWASANGAALLCATTAHSRPPVIRGLRDAVLQTICKTNPKEGVS